MQIDIGTTADGHTIGLPLRFANRHGLITGATGTGKSCSLQRLAEQFSAAGVPVFAADIKGDLSGIATSAPVTFWDVFGRKGHPIRTSVQDMGSVLLARMLNLNETQAGTLSIALKRAEDQADFLLTLDDLRWQLQDMQDDRETVCEVYGNITAASIATIQRNILTLEQQGGAKLFGEPPFNIADMMRVVESVEPGSTPLGMVNLLHADQLMEAPKLYGTLIYWLLTELFRKLPEVGDLDKPKLVFFFDEAHLLFKDAPKHLVDSIERVVRVVRSRGVGVYFVTQSPSDVPDGVLAQLGNRIQHALRGAAFIVVGLVLLMVPAEGGLAGALRFVGAIAAFLGVIAVFRSWVEQATTEVAVTNFRVIQKRGFIRRQTGEMNMDKVESVLVEQSLLGRLLGYGSIMIRGTGAGIEGLHHIAEPLDLRSAIVVR